MSDYRIFADATADICPEMMEGLPEITYIPMEVEIGGKVYLYGEGGNLTVRQFYKMQREGKFATTSQISIGTYLQFFEPALKAGQDFIYFPLTSGLSGTSQTARLCISDLAEKYPDRKMLCVDTHCASAGQGFIIRETAKKKAEGLSIEQLADWAEKNSDSVCHWFTVDVFDHLRHGGRVSSAAAMVGSALQIKPMLRVDCEGRLQVAAKLRGRRRAIAEKLEKFEQGWRPELGKTVVIGHGDDPEGAKTIRDAVTAAHPDAEVFTVPIGPVIGAHTGPGMLAIIYWGNNR